jgi:hypothetical protein
MVHAAHASTASAPAPLPTRHFLIASRQILKIKLTRSQQTRKHFLIASFSAIFAPAPHLTHHSSRITPPRLTPFLISTNKPHRIIIPLRAPLKTKEKQFSIPYKFGPRKIRSVSLVARARNARNLRAYSRNAACLALLVVLTCPAARNQIGWSARTATSAMATGA